MPSYFSALGPFGWTALVAVLALLVSLANVYFSFLRRGKLRVRFGEVILLQLNSDGRLILQPEIALYNPGATLAVTTSILFKLVRQSDDYPLVWTQNVTTVHTEERGRDTRFESYPAMLFIPAKQAVSKRFSLVTVHPFSPSEGDYEIVAEIESEGTASAHITAKTKIRLSKMDVDFLTQNQPAAETKVWRNLALYFKRGKNTNCFVRVPESK